MKSIFTRCIAPDFLLISWSKCVWRCKCWIDFFNFIKIRWRYIVLNFFINFYTKTKSFITIKSVWQRILTRPLIKMNKKNRWIIDSKNVRMLRNISTWCRWNSFMYCFQSETVTWTTFFRNCKVFRKTNYFNCQLLRLFCFLCIFDELFEAMQYVLPSNRCYLINLSFHSSIYQDFSSSFKYFNLN